jgi:23S rRNA pseudouridine1911/1915/1917 synthase
MKPKHNRHSHGENQRRRRRSGVRLEIVYEDDAIVAVNKPPGLPAVPIVKGSDKPSALSLLTAELKRKRQRAFVVHRIDRFTSGVLLFAKTQKDRAALIEQFLSHTPVRQYLAVVRGHVAEERGSLIHFLRRTGMFQQVSTAGDRNSSKAELEYSVERILRGASLVRVTLVTGLQNQIRVQFSAIGHPVVGDRKYHPAEAREQQIDRVALHASHLEFVHPRSGKKISLACDIPADFGSLVRSLAPPDRPKQ